MDRIIIGNKIRQIRKSNRLSQEEFAYRIGVSRQTVSSWELGVMKPEISKIKTICKLFDVKADEILFDSADDVETDIYGKNEVAACAVDGIETEDYLEESVEPDKHSKLIYRLDVFRRTLKYTLSGLFIGFLVFCLSVIAQLLLTSNHGDSIVRVYSFNFAGVDGLRLFFIIGLIFIVAIIFKIFVCDVIKDRIRRG